MIDRWFDSLTPRTTRRWAVRVLLATGPASLFVLMAWALRVDPWRGNRPVLFVMVYAALLMVACAAGMVAMLSSCHLAIGKAFGHGYKTAMRELTAEHEPATKRPSLHVVD